MPFVYPSECNTPSMFVPPSSCRLTRNLPMSDSFTPGGNAPRAAALKSAAFRSGDPNTNQGERINGKKRYSSFPANRMLCFRVPRASRRTHALTSAQNSVRVASDRSWYRPWSRSTICGSFSFEPTPEPGPGRSRTYTFPACGSPCTWPCTNTISENTLASAAPTLFGSNPACFKAATSLQRVMLSTNAVVRTRFDVNSRTTSGTCASGRPLSSKAHRSALSASPVKSSSAVSDTWKSRTSHDRSNPPGLICWPNIEKTAKSEVRWCFSHGYCSFTATVRPSFVTARCTCASDAAAIGVSSISANASLALMPNSSAKHASMSSNGRNGALSVSTARASMYAFGMPASPAPPCNEATNCAALL
mmetsp:Transcript_3553/g.15038  ORF Transcript_3553/g.15038 Transcript_3553/m.15038 type:complete len:362 (-) Transcript_3553:300-1385(-)